MLNQIAVCWAHLFFLPASVIKKMDKITANFIRGGQAERRKFHLSKLSDISSPKSMGGWDLLNLRSFGKALICKSLWRCIFGEGSWSMIIKKKYLGGKDFSLWFREGRIGPSYGSSIWQCLHRREGFFLENLIWRFQTGSKILIGYDQFLSGVGDIFVPEALLNFLHKKGFLFGKV